MWGGLGLYLLQWHAKEGLLLLLRACLYVQTRDLICFVCYSFSSLSWVLVWIWENPLCLHQRVVEWLWCMPVSPPIIIRSNEDVPTHSSFPLRVLIPRVPSTTHAHYSSFIHTFSTTFISSSHPLPQHLKCLPIDWLPSSLVSPWAVFWQRLRYL